MIIFVNLFFNQLKVFIRLDEAVLSVEDPEILTAILLETGAYHKKIPGFRPEMFRVSLHLYDEYRFTEANNKSIIMNTFQYAEEPFLNALQTTLDERYTPQMDVIYRVIAQYIIQTLIDGYNK